VLCLIMMRERVAPRSRLDSILQRRVDQRTATLVLYWLRLFLTRGRAPLRPIATVLRYDPALAARMVPAAFRRTRSKFGSRRSSSGAARDRAGPSRSRGTYAARRPRRWR
jgi:hypothetical protein